jgi:nucleotide-binding universal stress UspA family protein
MISSTKEGCSMFKKILFCTDFSENSHLAFTYALNLARTYQAKLLILHVKHDPIFVYPTEAYGYVPEETFRAWEVAEEKKRHQELDTNYLQKMNGFVDDGVLMKKGIAFYEIILTAKEESVDLIVMGTHRRTGLDHVLFGSTAERVVRKSPIPVLTVRLPGEEIHYAVNMTFVPEVDFQGDNAKRIKDILNL